MLKTDHTFHPFLTERFEKAMQYGFRLHAYQTRKGSSIPYIAHLLGVTSLVLEDGGDEDEAIAALLHDAVEDQGGWKTLDEIRSLFGERVARIVESCTDAFTIPKPPWQERKEQYLEHLADAPDDVRRVSLADKLYNARAILMTYHQIGELTWQRFNGGKSGTLWYYDTLVDIFLRIRKDGMAEEFARVVDEIKRLSTQSEEQQDMV
jgi:(p)ppGpp synthase/HD superfamily hydrolase